jgi:glycyl-tRNA synthetase (class II)
MQAHSEKSKQDLTAHETFAEPRFVEVTTIVSNKQVLGKALKKDAKAVEAALAGLCEEDRACFQSQLAASGRFALQVDGKEIEITSAMVEFKKETKKLSGR